jgi:hypothetical protein
MNSGSLDDQITTVTCRDAGSDLALRLSLDDLVTILICLCTPSDLALEQILTLFEIFEIESGCDVTHFREQRSRELVIKDKHRKVDRQSTRLLSIELL